MLPLTLVTGTDIIGYGTSTGALNEWSNDGTRWVSSRVGLPDALAGSISLWYGDGAFWMGGGLSGFSGTLYNSTDGIYWTAVPTATSPDYEMVVTAGCYANGLHVVVGYDHADEGHPALVQTSSDGVTWAYQTLENPTTIGQPFAVGYVLNKFFIGFSGGANAVIESSTDGASWSTVYTGDMTWIFALCGTGSEAVATVGDWTDRGTHALRSTNGTSWTKVAYPTGHHSKYITYGDGVYVSVGYGSAGTEIATSTDGGQSWTLRTDPTACEKHCVAYGSGLFVAAGTEGKIITSTNGTTWTERPNQATGMGELDAVAFSPVTPRNTFYYDTVYPTDSATTGLMRTLAVVLLSKATEIIQESSDTTNHAGRLRLAQNIMTSPKAVAEAMVWSILGDSDIQTNGEFATDTQVSAAVDSVINIFAV